MTTKANRTILVTGVSGQVGFELLRALQGLGHVVAADRGALDLADPAAIRAYVRELRPDLIVNPAAYTAVDQAEADVGGARAINADAPSVLAEEVKRLGALLVHYSTDYVFDGTNPEPYREDDPVNPQNVYGTTKLDGEKAIAASGCAHLIFRTSWVYGQRGKNFLRTMLRLAQERTELRVVADQVGTPTWSASIAAITACVIAQGIGDKAGLANWAQPLSGVYHLSASGSTSWAGFAEAIFAQARLENAPNVVGISSSEYPVPARRPLNSRLDTSKLNRMFSIAPPDWRDALALCIATA